MVSEKKTPLIAIGTWSWGTGDIGGDKVFGNDLHEKELEPVFDEAMKEGFNFWDTAYAYGIGSSEKILGTVMKKYKREDIIISTKFTPQLAGNENDPVEAMCNGSFERLGIDYIDLYWIHNPADVEKWTPYIIPLFKKGKIKRIGVSNHNLTEIKRVEEILSKEGIHVTAVQNHYSLLYRSSEYGGIIDYCKENKIEFFSYMVLEQGALGGKYSVDNLMPEKSGRGKKYNPLMPKIDKLIKVMEKIGVKYNASVSQIAMAWAVSKGTIPLIGITKTSQVNDIKNVRNIDLTKSDIEELEKKAESISVDTKGGWEKSMI